VSKESTRTRVAGVNISDEAVEAAQETLAEAVRLARVAAREEGARAQFEADLLGKPSPKNPHRRNVT
jgi:hypothetical protein